MYIIFFLKHELSLYIVWLLLDWSHAYFTGLYSSLTVTLWVLFVTDLPNLFLYHNLASFCFFSILFCTFIFYSIIDQELRKSWKTLLMWEELDMDISAHTETYVKHLRQGSPPSGHGPLLVHGLLGTALHSRTWVTREQVKLYLYL